MLKICTYKTVIDIKKKKIGILTTILTTTKYLLCVVRGLRLPIFTRKLHYSTTCVPFSSTITRFIFNENGKLNFEPKVDANIFKNFSNLADDLLKKLPNPKNKFNMDSVKSHYVKLGLEEKSFSFSRIDEEVILMLLQETNPSKAAGIHGLAGKFMKDGAPYLSSPITQMCNLSISLSTFPEKCKIAKLKPLYKKASTTEPKNYRPITLLPLISKLIEKIIHEQTQKYLSDHNILYKYQSGFCLSYLNDKILKGFDQGKITGMILIDLQKAFDTIDHKVVNYQLIFFEKCLGSLGQCPYLFCRRKTHPPLKTSLFIITFKNSNDIYNQQYPVILESVRKASMIVNNSNFRERFQSPHF